MIGIFVRKDGRVRYALHIVSGEKPLETRTRNVFKRIVGERVAIIETGAGAPQIVGYATIGAWWWFPSWMLDGCRDQTMIPAGSKYDCSGPGKYVYHMIDPEPCTPYPLPAAATRHGRSWVEW